MSFDYLNALKSEVKPALGCTEPTTVALAAAHCRAMLNDDCIAIDIEVSTHLYKNAMGVYVPGTGQKGLIVAAAAGWLAGDIDAGLEVLHRVNDEDKCAILQLADSGMIQLSHEERDDVLFTRVTARSANQSCQVKIEHTHTGLSEKILNGRTIFSAQPSSTASGAVKAGESTATINGWSVDGIVDFVSQTPIEQLSFISQAELLNRKLSAEGMDNEYGVAAGRTLRMQHEQGWLADDLMNRAMWTTAAASDARMGGAPVAAMSNSGSGNQGIAATLPVSVAADWLQVSEEQRIRALALSHLIAIYCKQSQYKLSALCAVTTAAMGASAAICWLMGGSKEQLHQSINNMVGDVSGMLCDGANANCALKISTSTASAVKAAFLAQQYQSVTGEGIVGQCADTSIANVGKLSRDGFTEADRIVVTMI